MTEIKDRELLLINKLLQIADEAWGGPETLSIEEVARAFNYVARRLADDANEFNNREEVEAINPPSMEDLRSLAAEVSEEVDRLRAALLGHKPPDDFIACPCPECVARRAKGMN